MKALSLVQLIAVAAFLSLVEVALILTGVLPVVMSYSPGNLLFALARLAVIAYTGVLYKGDLKKAAISGALIAFYAVLVLCLGAIAGKSLGKPVLGVSAPMSMFLLFVLVLAQNIILFAFIAVLAGWISRKAKHEKGSAKGLSPRSRRAS